MNKVYMNFGLFIIILFLSGCTSKSFNYNVFNTNKNKVSKKSSQVTLNSVGEIKEYISPIYFSSASHAIASIRKKNIDLIAELMNNETIGTLKLEGNTDDLNSEEKSFELGLKRGHEVKKALVAKGINSNRITVISYGKNKSSPYGK